MLKFETILTQSPAFTPKRYQKFTNLASFYRYRASSWEYLPHLAKAERQITAEAQSEAETKWSKALELPENALKGLHLVFGSTETCKEKLLDPETAKILRSPEHSIRIVFSRTRNVVGVKVSSPLGKLSYQYPYTLSLLCSTDELNYIRAGRFLQKTLAEIPKTRTVTLLPEVIEPILNRTGPTHKDFLLITID